MTGENRRTRRKISTLSTTNPTRTDLALKYVRGLRPAADHHNHGTARFRL
jgi:hypothetical protein